MRAHLLYIQVFIVLITISCSENSGMQVEIKKSSFGSLPSGKEVMKYTLTNANGMEVNVINYGGIITSLKVPDKNGKVKDVVLGFDDLMSYVDNNPYFGCLIGRYGNRIANGKFDLNGETYTLAQNNMGNHLHGGIKGFDKVYWDITELERKDSAGLEMNYTSRGGEEGYPGALHVTVRYFLTNDNALVIDYSANTDEATIVNLTNHTYFNLSGEPSINNHKLKIHAGEFLPVDSTLIPTGELRDVGGTPFDFRNWKAVGEDIEENNRQLELGGGYDHCWVLAHADRSEMELAAELSDSDSGILMRVFTTEPGVQFYSGNFLDGSLAGKMGMIYNKRSGLCLETQHFPDSPNQPQFPSVVLNPGEKYHSKTKFLFKTN